MPAPQCGLRAARPLVTCSYLNCSGQAFTGTTETQWAWSVFVLAFGFLLGCASLFYMLRRLEYAHQPPTAVARPAPSARLAECGNGTIVAVRPTSHSAPGR